MVLFPRGSIAPVLEPKKDPVSTLLVEGPSTEQSEEASYGWPAEQLQSSKALQVRPLCMAHHELVVWTIMPILCIQVVACKNSLVALDEEALPVISKRKKVIADVVVKILSAYYKRKKIATKVSHFVIIIMQPLL